MADELIFSLENNKCIYVNYSKMTGHDLEELSTYKVSKIRGYINIMDKILDTFRYMMGEEEVVLHYINLTHQYTYSEEYNEENFKADIFELLNEPVILSRLSDYVENNYVSLLDAKTAMTENVNEELKFTDVHAKILLKSALAIRFIIPVTCQFLELHPVKNFEKFLMEIYTDIFRLFAPESVNISNKLYRFIESRVISTKYNNRVSWTRNESESRTPLTATIEFHMMIVIKILAKLDVDRSPVSYLHTVIKNQLNTIFFANYPINYKPIALNKVDSDGLTEFEKIEVNINRADEGINIITQASIQSMINSILKEYKITITPEEYNFYKDNIRNNEVQKDFVFNFFSKYVASYKNLYYCGIKEYTYLCIILKKILERNNFKILPKFITARPKNYTEKTSINKKEFLSRLFASKKFINLHEKKYKDIKDQLINNGKFVKMIASLKMNKFYDIGDYEQFVATGEINEILIDEKIENLSAEVLNFIELV